MQYDEMLDELRHHTSGGGVYGAYEDIVEDGKVIVKGHRNTLERYAILDKYKGMFLDAHVLDIGSSLGMFCKYAEEHYAKWTVGIEKDSVFCKWAKVLSPKTYFINGDVNTLNLQSTEFTQMPEIDVVLMFSVWDYLDSRKVVSLLQQVCSRRATLFFEGHADGIDRIEKPIEYQETILPSWKHVLEQVLGVKDYKLLEVTEMGQRPFFKCSL